MVPKLHVVNEKLGGWPLETPAKFATKRPFSKGQKGEIIRQINVLE